MQNITPIINKVSLIKLSRLLTLLLLS